MYYNVATDPNSLTDFEWAKRYATLEDIRQQEKKQFDELGRIQLSDKD